jgi:hypothetical protein
VSAAAGVSREDVERAWELGLLSWLLDSNQLGIYEFIFSCGRKRVVLNCSRRIGKTPAPEGEDQVCRLHGG